MTEAWTTIELQEEDDDVTTTMAEKMQSILRHIQTIELVMNEERRQREELMQTWGDCLHVLQQASDRIDTASRQQDEMLGLRSVGLTSHVDDTLSQVSQLRLDVASLTDKVDTLHAAMVLGVGVGHRSITPNVARLRNMLLRTNEPNLPFMPEHTSVQTPTSSYAGSPKPPSII